MPKQTNPLAVLADMEKKHGSRKALAAALGYSAPYLTDVFHGRRSITDKMLGKLGLSRVVVRAK